MISTGEVEYRISEWRSIRGLAAGRQMRIQPCDDPGVLRNVPNTIRLEILWEIQMQRIRMVMVAASMVFCSFGAGDVSAENGFFERWRPLQLWRGDQDKKVETRLQTLRAQLEARGIPSDAIEQRVAERSAARPASRGQGLEKRETGGDSDLAAKQTSGADAASHPGHLSPAVHEKGFSGTRNMRLIDRPIDDLVRAAPDVRPAGNTTGGSLSSRPLDWHPEFTFTTVEPGGLQAQSGSESHRARFDRFRRSRGRR